jgi:hypothetical protein
VRRRHHATEAGQESDTVKERSRCQVFDIRTAIQKRAMNNRQMIADQLREVERHVALSETYIARQDDIVSEFERGGFDFSADEVRKRLASLMEFQKEHIARRIRLEQTFWGASSAFSCSLSRR